MADRDRERGGGCEVAALGDVGLVDEPQILGIRGLPAEAAPGEEVALEALSVGPDGPTTEPVSWSFCTTPRSVEERTGVTAACAQGEDLVAVGANPVILPDACARFGPNPPPAEPGEPPRRPADPDPTGGYYLPVQASTASTASFGFQRITCDLAGATRALFDAFQERYTPNQHPVITDVEAPTQVPPGFEATLEVRLTPDSDETFVVYVAETSELIDQTEELTVAWYVTGGRLAVPRATVRDGVATTAWVAPEEPGPVFGWVVVVDSRGGAAWSELRMEVP